MQQIAPMPVHLIFDESFRASGCIGDSFCCWDVVHGNQYNWSRDNLREVEKGWIKRASSIRELAGLVGLAPDVLEATVTRYNALVAQGEDADFGRNPEWIAAIETAPFYAMELTPSFVNTQGGPRRNENAQVIGLDGRPIPRLYSAGELGSIYAYNYNAGGNVGECFAFGRIAGRKAAREKSLEETEAVPSGSGVA
jgi:succinate dehydrogenase/fumarate reductase flavoprotein subunit